MKVLVNTCVWSLALRRNHEQNDTTVQELYQLIKYDKIQIIGAIRQEILSGIKSQKQFDIIKKSLSVFPDIQLKSEDYELAAKYFNLLRSKGIQGSNTDFLICATSINYNIPIFTLDNDFLLFQKYINIKLYSSNS